MSKTTKRKKGTDSDSSSEQETSLVDVDFEFFDPNPALDYQAIKQLLTQTFQSDAHLFQLHDLTDLILSQPLVGTTVKTDGKESDPFAVLTVLNMFVHREHSSIKALIEYVLSETTADPSFHATLQTLLAPQSQHQVGFVFSERLINMPVQIVPPMYRMLADEIRWAIEDNEPYDFSHLIFISRTYRLSPEEENALESPSSTAPSSKRQKASKKAVSQTPPDGIYSFHPEDSCIMQLSTHRFSCPFLSAPKRDKDAFGLDTSRRIMLMEASKLPELVRALSEEYGVDS